jgi:hypothetical protein
LGCILLSLLGDLKLVSRGKILTDRKQIAVLKLHVPGIVLDVDAALTDIQSDETVGSWKRVSATLKKVGGAGKLTLELVGAEKFGEGPESDTVVTVARLGEASSASQDVIGVVKDVVGKAVVVSHDDKAVVSLDNLHQGGQLGIVAGRGDVRVVDLEDLPSSVGVLKVRLQEIDLNLRSLEARRGVVIHVHGSAL